MARPVFLQASVMEQVFDSTTQILENFYRQVPYIIMGLLVFLLFLVLAQIVRRILLHIANRTQLDLTLGRMLGRLASGSVIILGLLIMSVFIFPGFRPADLVAGLGVTSVALGFVFRDILQNFFAGIFILWRKPFQVGDQVRSGDFEGTVIEINIRSTRIRTYHDTMAVIPNEDIYAHPLTVMTAYQDRRIHLKVQISYQDSFEEARHRILQVLQNTPGVQHNPEPWIYVGSLSPSWMEFDIYFWTQPLQPNVLKVSDQVLTRIQKALEEGQFESAYPHQVVHLHRDAD